MPDQTLEQLPVAVNPEETPVDGAQVDDDENTLEPDESDDADETGDAQDAEPVFSWEASEYVHHHKGVGWYAMLMLAVIVFAGIAAALHLWLEILAFLAMGSAIFVYARRPPRTLLYELSSNGITIDGRLSPFSDFRSFGVLSDESWHTIDLEPAKRFSPRLEILFDDDDFDAVVGHLEQNLPRVDRDPDWVERATRWLRF